MRPSLEKTSVKGYGLWIEPTTLAIPSVNDSEDGLAPIARRIKRGLGDDIPWHLAGYYPAYRLKDKSKDSAVRAHQRFSPADNMTL